MLSNSRLTELIKSEVFSGILLMISFLLAIMIANNDFLDDYYNSLLYVPISLSAGQLIISTTFIKLINDGMMAFFFLLIGLEMKFHLVAGEYTERQKLILPLTAAAGGVVVPALIYAYFNFDQPTLKGWAIPIASDTAFILGILLFFKRHISLELRLFILGFSLVDDAFALVILALFYTKTLYIPALFICFGLVGVLFIFNRMHVVSSFYYMLVGLLLWVAMVEAGIHGTLCGAIVALSIPVKNADSYNIAFKHLEDLVRPLVNYAILPLFIFMNSGVSFEKFSLKSSCSNVSLGIILGLFIGKQIGIMLFSWPMVKFGNCKLPYNTSWLKFYSVAILGGIGFTLSLFIGGLTFESGCPSNSMRSAVIIGSTLSAIVGVMLLKFCCSYNK